MFSLTKLILTYVGGESVVRSVAGPLNAYLSIAGSGVSLIAFIRGRQLACQKPLETSET